jgi:hypothetical protein
MRTNTNININISEHIQFYPNNRNQSNMNTKQNFNKNPTVDPTDLIINEPENYLGDLDDNKLGEFDIDFKGIMKRVDSPGSLTRELFPDIKFN